MRNLDYRAEKALPNNPGKAYVKLRNQVSKIIYERVPADPSAPEFRQGKTLGSDYKKWRRAKFGGNRFRIYFRYSEEHKIIAYAWMNDEKGKRKAGDKNDPYAIFQKMLDSGNPPDSMDDLLKVCEDIRKGTEK